MDSNNNLRVIVVSAIGGVLEYYDFVVFILFANIISQIFFPAHESEYLALAATYVFFAVGYFVRPIGGIILAHFGDRYGRKKIFLLTVFLMAIPTFLIGLIPTYASIGLIAPILLLLMRICQGLAMGGEIPGSSVFVYEHMTKNLKCSGISYLIAGLFGGILLGSIIGSIITKSLSNESLMVWGWRIPFLLGGLLGVVGMYLRSKLTETPIFMDIQKHNKQPKMPIGEILKNHKWSVIAGICTTLALASTVTTYYMYLPTYLVKVFKYELSTVFAYNSAALVFLIIATILTGVFSDRRKINNKVIYLIGALIVALFSIAAFDIMKGHNPLLMTLMFLVISIGVGLVSSVFVLLLIKTFPPNIRFSGVSAAYNISFAVFGGLTPLINTMLIEHLQNPMAPAYFVVVVNIIGAIALLKIKFLKEEL